MSDPKHADNKPAVVKLEPGTYMICACGHSSNQPYCDGSHGGTGIAPVAFEVKEEKSYAICNCKMSASFPLCDGSHKDVVM